MDVHVNRARGLLLVVFVVLFLSRRGDCSTIVEACQSLVQASLENPHCSPLGNCSGLECVASDGGRAEFTVRKCQDPVAVDLEYRPPSNSTNGSSSSVAFMRSFTHSQTVEGDPTLPGGTLEVDMARNDTYLSFGALPLIPHVLVPLNSSECLCASMSQLAQSPVAPVSCDVSDQLDYCDGVVCSLEVFGQGYKMELEVFSCTDPPSVHLTFRDLQGAVVYQHTFSDFEEVPVNLGVTVTLRFTLIHSNYSMTIRVDIVDVPLLGTINVLPEQTIILDLENCDSSLTGPPPTAPTGLPTGVPTPEACASLQQLASTATCQASADCSYVDCVILDPSGGGIYFLTVEPLPCETPPSLFFSLKDAFGNELYSRSLYENTTIDLGPLVNVNLTLLVVVTHPSSDALGIQVNLVLPEPVGTSTPVVPYSEIPLDESSCQNATGSPTHVSSATPPVDTTTPTCSALEGMAGEAPDSFSCSTNTEATRGTCDTVTCDTELLGTNYRAIAKVLPCHTPPAVMMVFLDVGSGRVLLNHTFTRSEEESILGGLVTVSVTLDQLENAIGLQIEATIPAQGTVTILPYSTIPIDTSNCNRGTQTTTASISPVKASTSLYATPPITVSTTPTTSMKGSTSLYALPPITVSTTPTSSVPISIPSVTPTEALPGKNRQVVVIAVSVVAAIVVVALGTAAVLGVALVYYRHRKQRRFQPISLRTLVNDEDDDDEDE